MKRLDLLLAYVLATSVVLLSFSTRIVNGRSFVIDFTNDQFLKDGQPYRYISGSIHYFRVPAVYWQDRLDKMWATGLNTIQIYVEWSLHEPEPLQYNFEGNLDLVKFLTLANQTGFTVVLRPGPYIDSELDFGGFPYWLLRENPYMVLRTNDPTYLNFVDSWMGKLLTMVRPFLYENGGPIISVQVENEYGSYYTCNYKYKIHLRDLFKKYLGNNVVLFTTDGASRSMLNCGNIDGVYPTVDFGVGSKVDEAFALQREFAPHGPLINSEFYTGWLDHWGEPHARVNVNNVRTTLDYMLSRNASVNMYMFHGGTSFGFTAGANMGDKYQACPTSYDYGAPLTEAGDPTDLLLAIRQVISKYRNIPEGPVPPPTKKYAYGYVSLDLVGNVFDMLPTLLPSPPVQALDPATFEDLGQAFGFVLYETTLSSAYPASTYNLRIPGIRDRAYIFIDKVPQAVISRTDQVNEVNFGGSSYTVVSILVENQGRICVGRDMTDFKGLLYNVTVNGKLVQNWKMSSLPLNNTQNINRSGEVDRNDVRRPRHLKRDRRAPQFTPSFYYGEFFLPESLTEPQDTFLDTTGWTKGVAFVNGFNLGRYWPVVGPQITLFVPKSVLLPHPQVNKLVLFEQDGPPVPPKGTAATVQFLDYPIIDSLVDDSASMKGKKPKCKNV